MSGNQHIVQAPDPILRTRCREVEFFDGQMEIKARAALAKLSVALANCKTPMGATTVGMAANQVGEPYRIIIVVQGGQQVVMINPVIIRANGLQQTREGCLSVEFATLVRNRTRPAFVQVEYQDEQGNPCRRKAKGVNAAAICHEVDHLNGILFTDGLEDAA